MSHSGEAELSAVEATARLLEVAAPFITADEVLLRKGKPAPFLESPASLEVSQAITRYGSRETQVIEGEGSTPRVRRTFRSKRHSGRVYIDTIGPVDAIDSVEIDMTEIGGRNYRLKDRGLRVKRKGSDGFRPVTPIGYVIFLQSMRNLGLARK